MLEKPLHSLLESLNPVSVSNNSNPVIASIAYDSRDLAAQGMFFALAGIHANGHDYIDRAVEAGAAAVVYSQPLQQQRKDVCFIQVKDTRAALSAASANFWDFPSRKITTVGVTGTDGKSTTVALIRQLLEYSGAAAGSLSTVEFSIGGKIGPNHFRQSTPEAPHIHEMLHSMVEAQQQYAVLEATSHGLSPRTSRLADVHFSVAVLTNITSEHLEFHGDWETYRRDKSRLFNNIADSKDRDAFGVVNADDPQRDYFIRAAGEKPVFTYSLSSADSDLYVSAIRPDASGTKFMLHTPWGKQKGRINLPGVFNLENLLAAICTVSELLGCDPLDFIEVCPKLTGIKGRMQPIAGNMNFHVMVDYAHSPGSFEKILPFLKKLVPGRLILVFGSAGERDVEKRPKQGRIADRYADIIILSDEDPREEDGMQILEAIAAGVEGKTLNETLYLIRDRREALQKAFSLAREGDLIAALGKGHEQSIIYADGPRPWDEAQVCREILTEMGFILQEISSQ
ncbi:MAG: UDP-N-acetylmuramoyl-L-alanyl-D-glutamate--2,6-diaminopimelate ligase [Spirochaeta sp. LUC14_002_19_P3]|nr:MAG: UDP-N-acetylmuramoyl-L-alanyl-D-glutamate--2,6-diaminopimelate ligase [Spirochaeta sp. LUC14_002_19_P3]